MIFFFFFQAEDGIRDLTVTGVQTCALPISADHGRLLAEALPQRGQRRLERRARSEEHTSELQSNLVCRLLLEKKKVRKLTSRITAALSRSSHAPSDESCSTFFRRS